MRVKQIKYLNQNNIPVFLYQPLGQNGTINKHRLQLMIDIKVDNLL